MPSLLVKVRKKMTIYAHQRVRTVLDGEYGSVFKGRSMDFDDLRAYQPGDDIKDIDWKATARSGQTLIRRYVAIRKHNILLVVNTGRSMAATAPSGETKRDISVLAAGVIAYIAQKHGDLVALVGGDSGAVQHMPLKSSTPHLERLLKNIEDHTRLEAAEGNLAHLLDYVARTIRRRTMLIIISDNTSFDAAEEQLLRRLQAQHELMFIGIDDLSPSDPKHLTQGLYDVDQPAFLPEFIRREASLQAAYADSLTSQWQEASRLLEHRRITSVRIAAEKDVVSQIVLLLERQKHARR
jgi:uncharacterized protein (DUF58 family)